MGKGGGYGSREGGPSGSGKGIPDYKRWKIVYEVDSKDVYLQQLDFFNIQIGVVESASEVIYRVSDVSRSVKVTTSSREQENNSLRFSHAKLRMKKWDQEIATRAGVPVSGALMCQFYPENVRNMIAQAEDAYLKELGRELQEVKRTNIKVVAEGSGFKFKIVNCNYK